MRGLGLKNLDDWHPYCDMVTNAGSSASVAGSTVGTMTDGTMHLLDPAPFGRILPAMVTPMKADGSVDFGAAQKLAKQLVADGADGLVVNGTTGESPTTHMEEKVELVQAVKDVVSVPVISGAGSNDTAHTVRMVEQTQEAGADAVLVVAPYYSRPSQEGVFRHYKAVNDSADKPIIVTMCLAAPVCTFSWKPIVVWLSSITSRQ